MKSFRVLVRRLSVLLGATLAGTVGILALTSTPAFAHHTTVQGEAVCDTETGKWVVTWTVENSMEHLLATLTDVSHRPVDSTLTGIVEGATVPLNGDGVLTGRQVVAGSENRAALTVQGTWSNGFIEDPKTGRVHFEGKCEEDKPLPNATFASACDGSVTVTLSNAPEAKKAADFTVTGEGGFTESKSVAAGATANVLVPAASAGAITVLVGTEVLKESEWEDPGTCAPVAVASKSDCTSLTVSVENPEGNRPRQVTVASGSATETFTLAAGASREFPYPATTGTTATVTVDNETKTVTWESPGNCVTTTPPPDLPVTGVKLSGLVGMGAALLVVGAALLLVLRRRRTVSGS